MGGRTGAEKPASAATASAIDAADSEAARVASLIPSGLIPEDGKRYYRIGEVSKITGVKSYVLRYWESESRAKQRLYRRKDIEMILLVRQLLHEQRYTIAGARKHLRDLGIGGALAEAAEETARDARARATNPVFSSDDAIEGFQAVRSELLAIREMLT